MTAYWHHRASSLRAWALHLSASRRRYQAWASACRQWVPELRTAKDGCEACHPRALIIDATAADNLTFLVTSHGHPYSDAGFGNWFRDACAAAGLPKRCAFHGLRKAACRRGAEAGWTTHQIAAWSGQKTLKEVERYTKAADQKRLAELAMNISLAKPEKAVAKSCLNH